MGEMCSMAGMCHGQKRQIQHVWKVSRSKTSDLVWLERVMVKNVRFSMSGKCRGQKRQI
jgi:hypothetical protein